MSKVKAFAQVGLVKQVASADIAFRDPRSAFIVEVVVHFARTADGGLVQRAGLNLWTGEKGQSRAEAFALVSRYQFQIFDALIVASALELGCERLYTEDLQHGQLIEGRLRIIDPFV